MTGGTQADTVKYSPGDTFVLFTSICRLSQEQGTDVTVGVGVVIISGVFVGSGRVGVAVGVFVGVFVDVGVSVGVSVGVGVIFGVSVGV